MGLTKTANTVWAPTTAAGVQRMVNLGDAHVWAVEVETLAQLNQYGADYWVAEVVDIPTGSDGQKALVFDDGASSGVYSKISGSWTKIGDLPGIAGPAGPPGEYTIADLTEAQEGLSNTVIMSPVRVTQWFNAKRPDQAEAEAGTAQDKAMTPLATAQYIDGRLADQSQAQNGVNAVRLMTPERTKDHVDNRIANQAQAEAGTSSTVLMSPLGSTQHFANRRASVAEAVAGSDNSKFVTALGVATIVGAEASARAAAIAAVELDVASLQADKADAVDLADVATSGSAGDLTEATDANLMTDAERTKLAGVTAGAEPNVVDSVAGKTGAVTLVKADVGLGSVDNTSDAAKPVSTATQTALDLKADAADLAEVAMSGSAGDLTEATDANLMTDAERTKLAGVTAGAEPNVVDSVAGKTGAVSLVKGDVGLGNVDNTSDAAKPVSTATQAALDFKADAADLADVAMSGSAGDLTEATDANLMTDAERTKLAGITAGAEPNVVDSVAGKTGVVTLVKADVGLGNVDNTSDAAKPVSTATQTALNGKAAASHGHAIGDVVGLQTALDAEAATRAAADTALSNLYASIVSGARGSPGLAPQLFSSTVQGKASTRPPISVGAVGVSAAYGTTWRIAGADVSGPSIDIGPRGDWPLRTGRIYRLTMIAERVTDPSDPLGDAVETRIRCLNENHVAGSDERYGDARSLTTAGGALDLSFTIARLPPSGVTVDYLVPGATRYIVPFLRIFGGAPHVTDVVLISVEDVTDLERLFRRL